MRISDFGAIAALAGLAACSDPPTQRQAEPGAQIIDCVVGGSLAKQRCMVERRATTAGKLLIVRHPDGGFRRFRQADNGAVLTPADGADAVRQQSTAGGLQVSIAGDTYNFPAGTRGDGDAGHR